MKIEGRWIKDEEGRTLILRGANLGGSSKVPASPDGATWRKEGFYDYRGASFVGRPFPEAEIDEHLDRLDRWGMRFFRFLVTWEAIEHDEPGAYDEAYLAYVRKVIKKAGDRGMSVFIDPHQDVWSRWTGGDGAPAWTLEKVGFRLDALHASGAAILHQETAGEFPRMIWPSNYNRYACATMFSLFFGGNLLAPETLVEGEPVQDYLQRHYLAALRHCHRRLKDLKNIAGFDSMNEPSAGWIGLPRADLPAPKVLVPIGPTPTAFQAMLAASGRPVEVDVLDVGPRGQRVAGKVLLNPEGRSAFREGRICPWRENGVWEDDSGRPLLRRPEHFAEAKGRRIHFIEDCLKPFIKKFASEMREVNEKTFVFIERVPNAEEIEWRPEDGGGVVNALHWYDGLTLFLKRYSRWYAGDPEKGGIRIGSPTKAFTAQIAGLKARSLQRMGETPMLLGEFGLPFDLSGGRAFRTGDFRVHAGALDAYYDAIDAALLPSTIWNYTADNSNARGDNWNGEDLSVFCRDQAALRDGPDSGGRALEGFVRPYAMATAGEPVSMAFELRGGVFEYSWRPDFAVVAPTEIYVPELQYPRGFKVQLQGAGHWDVDAGRQLLLVSEPSAPIVRLRVTPL